MLIAGRIIIAVAFAILGGSLFLNLMLLLKMSAAKKKHGGKESSVRAHKKGRVLIDAVRSLARARLAMTAQKPSPASSQRPTVTLKRESGSSPASTSDRHSTAC
jgi:hypothetical protein